MTDAKDGTNPPQMARSTSRAPRKRLKLVMIITIFEGLRLGYGIGVTNGALNANNANGVMSALLLIGGFVLVPPEGLDRAFVSLLLTVTFLAFQQVALPSMTWLRPWERFQPKLRGFGSGSARRYCG